MIGGATWDRAGEHLYYTTVDDSWRADKVWRHRLGTTPGRRRAGPPRGGRPLLRRRRPQPQRPVHDHRRPARRSPPSTASSTPTPPTRGFRVFSERREGLEYSLDHAVIGGEDVFLVLHNAHRARLRARRPRRCARPRPRTGRRWSPTTPPYAWRTSTRSPATWSCTSAARGSPSCASSSSGAGRRSRDDYLVEFDHEVYTVGSGGNPGFAPADRAARLHDDGGAVVGLRLRRPLPRAHAAAPGAGARRLRPGRLRGAPALGHRRGRRAGPDLDRLPARRPRGRRRRHAPGARPCSTATAPTRPRSTRTSRSPGSPCSTAARRSRSPTCAAAARWAGGGTTTASSTASSTRSPTSSPAPGTWSRRGWTTPGARWWRRARAPAGCSWVRSPTRRRSCSAGSWPGCRSSTT